MRIGLVRHFPVIRGLPTGWLTAAELHQWKQEYDESDVTPGPIDTGAQAWTRCLSSDLRRAFTTAQAAFPGPIEQTPLLREAEFLPFQTGNLPLPIWVWKWMLRITWMTGHPSQRAARDAFQQRVKTVAARLVSEPGHTLVVSHAGMMHYLRRELLQRGFQGPSFRVADHATLYVFEKPQGRGLPTAPPL